MKALNNGDQNTLNSLQNRFTNEFGGAGPVTARAISDAYTREVTKMLSSGHLTDSEISTVSKTLDVNRQSQQQSLGVIGAYKALASSKMQQRRDQVEQGMMGKPNFPAGTDINTGRMIDLTGRSGRNGPPAGATMQVPGSDGKLHWSDGKRDLGLAQ